MSRLDMTAASVRQAGSSRISVSKLPEDKRLDEAGVIAMKEGTKSRIDNNKAIRNRSMRDAACSS